MKGKAAEAKQPRRQCSQWRQLVQLRSGAVFTHHNNYRTGQMSIALNRKPMHS